MNFNQDIHSFYKNNDEHLRLNRTPYNQLEFETTLHYLLQVMPQNAKILDACSGTGRYAAKLKSLGFDVVACDLVADNIEKLREVYPELNETHVCSVEDLSGFKSGSFDVVLNFGAYYHEIDNQKRSLGIKECLRVLGSDGILGVAYLNRYANVYKHIDTFSSTEISDCLSNGYYDGNKLFYKTTPEIIAEEMNQLYLKPLYQIATDGPKYYLKDKVNLFTEEEFKKWKAHHITLAKAPSLLGMSEHGLYIGKKVASL